MVELFLERYNLVEQALDIIENGVKLYFTVKLIGGEILSKEGYYLRGRSSNEVKLNKLKRTLSYRLLPIVIKLKELGYIKKANQKQWIKQKPLDITPNELIECLQHRKRYKSNA